MFDLDGTLADTAGEIVIALDRAFAELGIAALPEASVREMIGGGVVVLVERAQQRLGLALDVAAVVARFEAHYADLVGTSARLYPGVRGALARLRESGLPLAVVTNKPRVFTERLLRRLDIAGFFSATVAGDDGWPKKPSGEMLVAACTQMHCRIDESLMVGDSVNDVLGARAAGCRVWCVPYGYSEGLPVESLACDRVVGSLDEAVTLVLDAG